MTTTTEATWSEEGTTPDAIEAALRDLVKQLHTEHSGFAPARALNMIAFIDDRFAEEIASRLGGVGRYHASRTVLISYEPDRTRLDARAIVSSESEPAEGELGLLHETVIVEIGERHLDDLITIAAPLVVTDLATLLWSPQGHPEAVDTLLGLAQTVLVDSVEAPSWREAIRRACRLQCNAYVVDLDWVRGTHWRERLAARFDPPAMREELEQINLVEVRHHPSSTVAAMLLVGWLSSRLGWEVAPLQTSGHTLMGSARAGERTVSIRLEQTGEHEVHGLHGIAIGTDPGRRLGLRRGEGGLRARSRDSDGTEREWTILGASHNEGGLLGAGIRQALLRDPTYVPALHAIEMMAP